MQNNQGQGRDYQQKAEADNPYRETLIILDVTKTDSNNGGIMHGTTKKNGHHSWCN